MTRRRPDVADGHDRRRRRVARRGSAGGHVPRDDSRAGPCAARGRRDGAAGRGGDARSTASRSRRRRRRRRRRRAPEPDVEEVEVHGEKPPREVTKRTLEQREISRIPGTNGDALRSLRTCPASRGRPGFAGLLIVRGSAPQDTQYFVDGTPVPLVYHFGGLSSVVPTEMLDRIDFYPGNFSAQYGRAHGRHRRRRPADPKSDRLHGMAQVDLIDARVLAQGPIFDTGWSFAVAGRRSYFDAVARARAQGRAARASASAPVYYDYQAILERDLGKRSIDPVRVLRLRRHARRSSNTDASSSEPELGGQPRARTRASGARRRSTRTGSATTPSSASSARSARTRSTFNAGNLIFNLDRLPDHRRASSSRRSSTSGSR